eukprot:767619-Hanusia_phi.AAC.2
MDMFRPDVDFVAFSPDLVLIILKVHVIAFERAKLLQQVDKHKIGRCQEVSLTLPAAALSHDDNLQMEEMRSTFKKLQDVRGW